MFKQHRIDALVWLGEVIGDFLNHNKTESIESKILENAVNKAIATNPWFSKESVFQALNGINLWLNRTILNNFTAQYPISDHSTAIRIGVVMAGNIPLVGFHDALCVILSGHQLHAKPSSEDQHLIKAIKELLVRFDAEFENQIIIADQTIKNMDSYIATGSNNTARYFEYYFSKVPNIIRQNRNSVAVITGNENAEELKLLGKDMFQYYGKGCRNVSSIRVPTNYDLMVLMEGIKEMSDVALHPKYLNNYDYQKAAFIIGQKPFADSGFCLITEHENLASPIAVLHFKAYETIQEVNAELNEKANQIQCVVSVDNQVENAIIPGQAQSPKINDFADQVDTLAFLSSLK